MENDVILDFQHITKRFPTDAMDLAVADLEGDIIQGRHAGEAFGDMLKIQNNISPNASPA